MIFSYAKGNKIDLTYVGVNKDVLSIIIEQIDDIKLSPGELIAKLITNHPLTKFYGYDEEELCALLYCILKGDESLVSGFCMKKNEPFLGMNKYFIKKLMNAYKTLSKKDENSTIAIKADKDNFLECINFAKNNIGDYIIVSRTITLNEYYNLLKDINLENYSNVVIDYQDFTSPVDIKTLFDITNITKDVIDTTINNNLSPLEQILYVYDVLKRREYKDDKENLLSARDIDKVLKGDNIVCLGYANLFSAILSSIGVENKVVPNIKGNHARNIVHLKDEKYGIDSILFFDVTWDAKKNNNDNYLHKYNYFGISLEEASYQMDEELYHLLNKEYNEIKNIILNGTMEEKMLIEDAFELCSKESYNTFFSHVLNDEQIAGKKMYESLQSYYKKNLPVRDFALALHRVREIEYKNYVIDDIDITEFKNSIINKYNKTIAIKGNISNLSEEEIKDLKLDLYIEMCLIIIPFIDQEKNQIKKRIKKKEENY